MPTPVLMPALSPTMTEGTLAKWVKKEGETVSSGDVIAEIETDKATMEVEAVDEGKLAKIIVAEGTANVAVNSPIAVLLEEGESLEDIDLKALKGSSASEAAPAPEQSNAQTSNQQSAEAQPSKSGEKLASTGPSTAPAAQKSASQSSSQSSSSGGRIFASPLAKRMATEKGIDLRQVQGSGPKGRIIKRDIETFQPTVGGAYIPSPRGADGMPLSSEVTNTTMRKAIARRLSQSKQQVPHFYLTVECELDNLLSLRKSVNKKAEKLMQEGDEKPPYKVSVNDFVIKAVGLSLIDVPEANAMWTDDAIKMYNSADISVAVAIEGGLITPIVKDAQSKSLVEISKEMKQLAGKARKGQLQPQEYEGGTFSLSNLGMFGIETFQAIINPPQGCILAIGAGVEKPVVKDGDITTATVMKCTLSVDHRVVDGAVGAQFMAAFKEYIEDPAMMLV